MYHGDIRLGDTIDIKFSTRAFSTGLPTTLAGTPSVAAYPGNSTTEITAGITLTVDLDSRTGMHNVRIVATSGNGYATATNYTLVITAGTVGGTSVVGECVGSFSIENRSALMPATAARTLVVDAAGLADANMVKAGPSGSGTAQTAKDLGAINVTNLNTLSGHDPGEAIMGATDLDATLATIASYIDTEVAAIKAKTDNLPASPAAVGSAMTLTAAYDAAKTAATQASVDAVDDFVDTEVAAIKTVVDAIKVKTDSLTFTKAGELDANIQSVNDVTVNGNGAGTPWGP